MPGDTWDCVQYIRINDLNPNNKTPGHWDDKLRANRIYSAEFWDRFTIVRDIDRVTEFLKADHPDEPFRTSLSRAMNSEYYDDKLLHMIAGNLEPEFENKPLGGSGKIPRLRGYNTGVDDLADMYGDLSLDESKYEDE